MSLMRAVTGVATGFLGARVEQYQAIAKAKADEKRMLDEINARKLADIEVLQARLDKEAELKELDEAAKRKKRKENAIALGFTEEFLDNQGQFMLSSDANFDNYINLGKETYQVPRWWDTPIQFGDFAGQTVQDMMLQQTPKGIKSNDVKNSLVNNNNLSSNVAGVSLGEDTIEPSIQKKGATYTGGQLFFGKSSLAKSEGKQYINRNGQIVTGYQKEQTPGKKNYGPEIYHDVIYNEQIMPMKLNPNEFFDISSESGKKILSQNLGLFKSSSSQDYQVFYQGKNYRISSINREYDDGRTEKVITSIDPELAKKFGTSFIQEREVFSPADRPAGVVTEPNNLEIPVEVFQEVTGLPLRPYNATEFFNANKLRYAIPDLTMEEKRNAKSNALISAGFSTKDFGYQTIPGTDIVQISISEINPISNAANSFDQIIESAWAVLDRTQRDAQVLRTEGELKQEFASELGITNKPFDITKPELAAALGNYYTKVREDTAQAVLNDLKNLEDDKRNEMLAQYNVDLTESRTDEELASEIALKELTKFTDIDSLLTRGIQLRQAKVSAEIQNTQLREEQTKRQDIITIAKYFPKTDEQESPIEELENFVNSYITDPNNEQQARELASAVNNLTDTEAEADILYRVMVDYLESDRFTATTGLSEIQKTRQETEKDVQNWLNKNKVETAEELGGLDNWNKKYKTVKGEGFLGGLTSDYDSDTGLKLYVNPNLEPGHVEPRPKGVLYQPQWDRLWSNTHNTDGTPKQ